MSYMRHPIYAWVSGCVAGECREDECENPDHLVMNLWVRDDVGDPFGMMNPKSYEGFQGGIQMPLAVFDLIAYKRVERIEDLEMASAERQKDEEL